MTRKMGEGRSQAESTLLVELCRYFAQVLYAVRNGLDSFDRSLPEVELPQSGVIPARTILIDGGVGPYRAAAGTLLQCGFATEQGHLSGSYVLDVASGEFTLGAGPDPELRFGTYPDEAFLDIFKIYEVNGRLGHPGTLRRMFSLFLQVGLTEIRHGHVDWSQPALELAERRGLIPSRTGASDGLWPTDTFDLYIEDAERQWLQPQET